MSSKTKSIAISIFFIAFGAFLYNQSLDIRTLMSNDVGSSFFPKFVASAIVLIAVVKLIFTLKDKNEETQRTTDIDLAGGWMTIVLLGLYVLVFSMLGFIIATAIYLFLQILVLTPKSKMNYPMIGTISVVTPFIIYTLFVYVIRMPLPKGMFGF